MLQPVMCVLLYTAFWLAYLQSQHLDVPISEEFLRWKCLCMNITLSPVDFCNTSVLLCLDILAPVPICFADSSALVLKCLGSELSPVRSVCTPVFTTSPVGVSSTAMSVSVYLSLCLYIMSHKPHVQTSRNFLYMMPGSVFSDDNAIHYVLPVS